MSDIYSEIGETLTKLIGEITNDPSLDDEHKAELIDLINEVVADPTPNNIQALALVMEETGKSQEYSAALDLVNKYSSQQTPTEDVSTPVPSTT